MSGPLLAAVRRRWPRPRVGEPTPPQPTIPPVVDAGPLQPLLDDPTVSDVLVNGPGPVWIDRGAGPVRTTWRLDDARRLRELATRLAAGCGRRLDDAHPFVDARLPDGTRLHAVLPPIAVDGPFLSLRPHRRRTLDLAALHRAGSLPGGSADLVRAVITSRHPFLVTGGTGTGKTTLLAAMLAAVPGHERVVVVEDAAELAPRHPHTVCLQTRGRNVEGAGGIGMSHLVREALRMRPDRIVIGECRGTEVVDLLTALNTGHDGGCGTLHANSPADVPARLTALALPAGLTGSALRALLAAAVHIVIHMRREGGRRFVAEIGVLDAAGPGDGLTVVPGWRHDATPVPGHRALRRMLRSAGPGQPVTP